MSIDAGSGLITWTPVDAQSPSTNLVIVRLSDGLLSDTKSFTVVVRGSLRITHVDGSASHLVWLQWTAEAGGVYRMSLKQQLTDPAWTTLREVTATGISAGATNNVSGIVQGFFTIERVK